MFRLAPSLRIFEEEASVRMGVYANELAVSAERVGQVCRKYQVVELAVFGSAVRGEMRADSDVDVVVEFAPGVVWGLEYFELESELAAIFGRREILLRRSG